MGLFCSCFQQNDIDMDYNIMNNQIMKTTTKHDLMDTTDTTSNTTTTTTSTSTAVINVVGVIDNTLEIKKRERLAQKRKLEMKLCQEKKIKIIEDADLGVDNRYMLCYYSGAGSFGTVYSACSTKDEFLNDKYPFVVKKIYSLFSNVFNTKCILREILFARWLNHPHILKLHDIIPPKQENRFDDIVLVYPRYDTDLHYILNSNQILTEAHIQLFMYQIIYALVYLHSMNIMHRDIKPANIFVNSDCHVVLGDLGTTRVHSDFMNEHVCTRWYRSPELILSSTRYDTALDMWSLGCVFAQLLGGQHGAKQKDTNAIFRGTTCFPTSLGSPKNKYAFKSDTDQLNVIFNTIGTPSDSDIDSIISTDINTENTKKYLSTLPKRNPIRWDQRFPHASPHAIDLLGKLICIDPKKRITAEEALLHPFIFGMRYGNEQFQYTMNDNLKQRLNEFETKFIANPHHLRPLFLKEIHEIRDINNTKINTESTTVDYKKVITTYNSAPAATTSCPQDDAASNALATQKP
jgi:serine/threonine protein kinase